MSPLHLTIEFIDGGTGVRLISEGRVPGDELARMYRSLAKGYLDAFRHADYWYADHSALEVVTFGDDDARALAAVDEQLAKANPGLIVTKLFARDFDYGLSPTCEGLAARTGWTVATFRDRQELARWLEDRLGRPAEIDAPRSSDPALMTMDLEPEAAD